MQTVENPKKLFRKIDATSLDEDESYSLITEGDDSLLSPEDESMSRQEVEFKDLSDPADDFHEGLGIIEENATLVKSENDIPDNFNTEFHTQENGTGVTYYADSDRLGYEIVKRESNPRLAAYVVVDDDALLKVEQ